MERSPGPAILLQEVAFAARAGPKWRSRHRETSGVHARAYPTRNRHPLLVSMLGWLNAAFGSSRAAGRGTRGGTRGDGDAVRDADATRAPGESSTSGSPTGAFRGCQSARIARWQTGSADTRRGRGGAAREAAWVTERGDAGGGVRAGRVDRGWALNGVLLGL